MKFPIDEVPVTNSGSTGRTLRCVKYAAQYLKKHGNTRLSHDYTMLKLKNAHIRIIPAFSEEETSDISAAVGPNTPIGMRDLAVILLGYGTGLRGADIIRLKLSDIGWRGQCASTVQSKTHQPLSLALNGAVLNAIADYVLYARPECSVPQVFVTVKAPYRKPSSGFANMVDKYCEKAGVEKIPLRAFHSLRRSFETVMASHGVPIETVSQMVGHKAIEEDKPYITHNKEKASFIHTPLTAGQRLSPCCGNTQNTCIFSDMVIIFQTRNIPQKGLRPSHICLQMMNYGSFFQRLTVIQVLPVGKDTFQKWPPPVYSRFLYCCGMRPQEPPALLCRDVNLSTGDIYIRQSKRHKDRHIIISEGMLELCNKYDALAGKRGWFFQKWNGGPYETSWYNQMWRRLLEKSQPVWRGTPRPYDLRHAFASRNIIRWMGAGKDAMELLPYLSAYMGHSELASTLYYIHMLPEKLRSSAKIDWEKLSLIYGKGVPEDEG